MDDFTKQHLADFASKVCYDDERDAFIEWAIREVEADPLLADYGWRPLWDRFCLTVPHKY